MVLWIVIVHIQIWSPQNISANDGDANLVHGTKVALRN